MSRQDTILLTGASGLLGRHLLRDLLLAGRKVAVLARGDSPNGKRSESAEERVGALVSFWSDALGTQLARPLVLEGELTVPGLGLTAADRAWLARSCRSVLHAAACVSLRSTLDGEPWKTNADGTKHLLALCTELGLLELHHVSTAFVCGKRSGTIREEELEQGQSFHNDYERSKCAAECHVRQTTGIRATVYRPSVIVGDSRTGYTSSYHGFYRFLECGDRLAETCGSGRRSLPVRLPFTGDEPRDLVPVDWVSQAITRIVCQPALHGRTYHLTAAETTQANLIKEVAEELLGIEGVRWAGSGELANPSPLEEAVLQQLAEYWPYRHGDPSFDRGNTRAALSGLPPPVIDRALLSRLIRFGIEDRWGRRRTCKVAPARLDCARYVEDFFPEAVLRSSLAGMPLAATVGLEVRGVGGGRWTCWLGGEGQAMVQRGMDDCTEVVYRLDVPTFVAIIAGQLDLQEAFLTRRVEIAGHVEKGLKLAVLLGRLLRECPFPHPEKEPLDACPVSL
jgi:thioester reductase-like protein